jgi:hypothetical protein
MTFPRSSSIALGISMMMAIASFAYASNPHLRIQVGPEDNVMATDITDDASYDANFPHPEMELGFEKNLSCKGGTHLISVGAEKKCDAQMKKTVRIGMSADEVTDSVASDMEMMFHDLMPVKDGFLPMEEDMIALTDMDEMGIDEMEDGASNTVKFGGFFKLMWDCSVTFKKEGPLKFSKTVNCGAKALEGMGMESQEDAEKE